MNESLPNFDESVIQSEEEPEMLDQVHIPESHQEQQALLPIAEESSTDTSLLNLNIDIRQSVEAQTQTKKKINKKVVPAKIKERHEKLAARPK